jgi:hypothetical protein
MTVFAYLAFAPLCLFSGIFGPLLLLFPGSTSDYWAWQVRPDMSAVWIGCGYTFGSLAQAAMLWRGRASSAFVPIFSTIPFAWVMLAATVIHNDRFFDGSVAYYIWLAIYVILPFALPPLAWQVQRRDRPVVAGETLLSPALRLGFIAVGAPVALLGLVLILAPGALDQRWPWTLTPLMSRVVGGWLLFAATGALCASFEARYEAYRYYLPLAAVWFTLLFAGSIANFDDFDDERLATPLYFFAVAGTVVGLLGVIALMERRHAAATREASHRT